MTATEITPKNQIIPTHAIKPNAERINESMAKHLKSLRHEEDKTMRALAIIIGTPHSFIGKVEQQGRRLDVGEFIVYCRGLNKNPVTVLEEIIALDEANCEASANKQ